MNRPRTYCVLVGLAAWCLGIGGATGTELFDETRAITLFAFDQVSIPHTQNLRLEMQSPRRHPANPVVRRGAPGSVDAHGVQFYGSIIREGDRYRMWYVAFDDDLQNRVASARWRPAYAESRDGVTWTKPSLGLVEFAGSTHNNLIRMEPGPWGVINLKVLKDNQEADPERRYKISTHVYFRHNTRLGTLAPFASADGLVWTLLADAKPVRAEMRKEDLVLPGVHFEPCGGLYQWDGQFFICGQNAMPGVHHYQGRVVRLYRSADFIHWSTTSTIAFIRTPQNIYLGAGRSREGEQNHEGISVWNRRNVLLGITGRWHGATEWKGVSVDLGLVISNDGLNFREPKHEWTFLQRGEDGQWDQGGLLQGQGFENIGDETYVYYGAWDPRPTGGPEVPRGGVGIAVLPRDRFGALVVDTSGEGPGDYQWPRVTAELVTASIAVQSPRLYVNADGLGPDARLRIELLDHLERPLPDYSGEHATVVDTSGFQEPVVWKRASTPLPDRLRIRAVFEGAKRTEIRLHALYVVP